MKFFQKQPVINKSTDARVKILHIDRPLLHSNGAIHKSPQSEGIRQVQQ